MTGQKPHRTSDERLVRAVFALLWDYEERAGRPTAARVTYRAPDQEIHLVPTLQELPADEVRKALDRLDYMNAVDEELGYALDHGRPRPRSVLMFRPAGEAWEQAGLPMGESLAYTTGHLVAAVTPKGSHENNVRHPHGLTTAQVYRLPELLENPVLVMDSDYDDRMIAVLDDIDGDGQPLIAILKPNEKVAAGKKAVDATMVLSFYGKKPSSLEKKIRSFPERVVWRDMERGRHLDAQAELQLFSGHIAGRDLDRKIMRLPTCVVKMREKRWEQARIAELRSMSDAELDRIIGAARPLSTQASAVSEPNRHVNQKDTGHRRGGPMR